MIGAWCRIAILDILMARRGFPGIHRFIQRVVVRGKRSSHSAEELCGRVDRAAVYYSRQLHCLRRSAAMTWLLRNHGYAAEMVVGASITPFFAHAWVELDGRIITDDERLVRERYTVLERYPALARS
jgi:hypothetical protein